ncbi:MULTISPECIES: hypothetical protein [unclassified Pseudonocardia]|jgi:hypothetical protein|uniref:hypothetical protein n=1 Tax=unclassified Pseudonocardia TaxID=2619320 RepID=UPI0002F0D996|nr:MULTISPECIES: hypothetical protein [unclassified Pseudonocardia]ALL81649.1 hypothetical protein AD017_11385 [Pseudonocardia sp. EC080619-01]OLM16088.1 hypothetical protein Ae707Ps1_0346 [Pseudonocardia sp. Ae707_Ps1]
MANAPQPARRRRALTLVGAAVVAPLATLAFTGSAQAAELTPVAEYIDDTVADTDAQVGAVVDALGFEAE